jgi:transcriptional regulator with XRE-family HTH domain
MRSRKGVGSSPYLDFGLAVEAERERQCLTVRALAAKGGMHASEISRVERGLRDPRLSTMLRIARALDVPLIALLGTNRP